MIRLAVIFLVVGLIFAAIGFGAVAQFQWEGAQYLFYIFLALAVLSFLGERFTPRRTS